MPELKGPKGEINFTLSITRAATGKVEEVKMRGYTNLTPEELQAALAGKSPEEVSQLLGAEPVEPVEPKTELGA